MWQSGFRIGADTLSKRAASRLHEPSPAPSNLKAHFILYNQPVSPRLILFVWSFCCVPCIISNSPQANWKCKYQTNTRRCDDQGNSFLISTLCVSYIFTSKRWWLESILIRWPYHLRQPLLETEVQCFYLELFMKDQASHSVSVAEPDQPGSCFELLASGILFFQS